MSQADVYVMLWRCVQPRPIGCASQGMLLTPKVKACGNPALGQWVSFPTAFVTSCLCHMVVILAIFLTFHYFLCWSLITACDLLKAHHVLAIFLNKVCMLLFFFFKDIMLLQSQYTTVLQCSVNITYALSNNKKKKSFDSVYCFICFIVVVWNGPAWYLQGN